MWFDMRTGPGRQFRVHNAPAYQTAVNPRTYVIPVMQFPFIPREGLSFLVGAVTEQVTQLKILRSFSK
jgi:hypothetical protein